MDVTGRYTFVKLASSDFWGIFGTPVDRSAPTDRLLTIGGKVTGENPHGLWIEAEGLFDHDGVDITPEGFSDPKDRGAWFVRWDRIKNAVSYAQKPASGGPSAGFHPR
jgi:hypothetical protein